MTTATTTVTATVQAINDTLTAFLSTLDSINGNLSDNTELLDICRRQITEVSSLMVDAVRKKLQQTFTNEVTCQPKVIPTVRLPDKYDSRYEMATISPYQVINTTTGKVLTPGFDGEYPQVGLYLSERNENGQPKNTTVKYHRLVAETLIANGQIDKGMDVDHKGQDRFNWSPEHLQVITSHTNQLNRGGSEWIEVDDVDRLWQAERYLTAKGKGNRNITNEQIYLTIDDDGEIVPLLWVEEVEKLRRCKVTTDGKVRGLLGGKYSFNLLKKSNPSPYPTTTDDDDDVFSQP